MHIRKSRVSYGPQPHDLGLAGAMHVAGKRPVDLLPLGDGLSQPLVLGAKSLDLWSPRLLDGEFEICGVVARLFEIASAYEAGTRHRRAPKGFGPLAGEP